MPRSQPDHWSPPGVADSLPLTQHRLRARISLDDIIAVTKISRRFLEAIEAGDYRQLPGGIIGLNYVRQYAEVVGYDSEALVDHYRKKTGQCPAPEASPVRRTQTQSILRLARFLSMG